MSIPWLSINNRLAGCVRLINALPRQKFSQLLHRINETNDQTQIADMDFELSENETQLLVQSALHIWRHATKVVLKPTDLRRNLIDDLKLDTDKADDFVQLWTQRLQSDCGDLENRKRLENVSWELNLRAASDLNPKEKIPGIMLQLSLSNLLDGTDVEDVTLNLNEEELLKFYNTLESVQNKLDKLQSI